MGEHSNGRRCGTCLHFSSPQDHPMGQVEGECRRYPPQTHMIPAPNQLNPKQLRMQVVSGFPTVSGAGHFCFEWKSPFSDELALAEGQDLKTGTHG